MKTIHFVITLFLILVGLAFLNVAIQAFFDPQAVMDFVAVHLDNSSARNSIRAYYGGVNLAFGLFLIYGGFKMKKEALLLASLYGGGFVIGRLYSMITEGMPSSFILTWLVIESILALISVLLLTRLKKVQAY